jgi:hypothetical protein
MKILFEKLISEIRSVVQKLKTLIDRNDNDRFNDPYTIF